MEDATLKQAKKLLEVFESMPNEQLQAIHESGLLADLRDANISQINRDEFRKMAGLKPLEEAKKARAKMLISQPVPPAIPADGVEFELTLVTVPDPLEMVKNDGYDPKGWEFNGAQVVPQTRRFKLARVGYCRNLDEVRQKIQAHGEIPEGQWREAFRQVFPKNDGKGPIGFADPSWVYPNGRARFFPLLHGGGELWFGYFHWAGDAHVERWRWLVPCK